MWRIEGRRHLCTAFGPHQRHLYPVVLAFLVSRIKSWLVDDKCVILVIIPQHMPLLSGEHVRVCTFYST
jgi:hypothetical protein